MGIFGTGSYGAGNYGGDFVVAAGLASTYANDVVDYLLGGGSPTSIAAVYIKLHTGNPGSAGTSNAASETTREQATFAASSGGSAATSADLTWSSVSTTETYSHYSAWDASTAGNFLFSGALTETKNVTAGDDFTITAGNLTVAFIPVAA